MALISDANDVGFYVGPAYNQSLAPYQILLVLKALAKTGCFRVIASGDGDGLFSNTGDILDNDTASDPGAGLNDGVGSRVYVAGSLSNVRAWFILAPKAGAPAQGQRCIQVLGGGSTSLYLRVKDSTGGFDLTTASASVTPQPITPGDEKLKEGNGTDASPTYGIAAVVEPSVRVQCVASDDEDFPFLSCLVTKQGTNVLQFWCVWDFLVTASLNGSDSYPYEMGWVNDGQIEASPKFPGLSYEPAIDAFAAGCVSFSTRYGSGLTCNTQIHQIEGYCGRCGTDTLNNRDALIQLSYSRYAVSGGADTGFKGYSYWLRGIPSVKGMNEPVNVASATSREYSSAFHIAIPWAKSGVDPIQ